MTKASDKGRDQILGRMLNTRPDPRPKAVKKKTKKKRIRVVPAEPKHKM